MLKYLMLRDREEVITNASGNNSKYSRHAERLNGSVDLRNWHEDKQIGL